MEYTVFKIYMPMHLRTFVREVVITRGHEGQEFEGKSCCGFGVHQITSTVFSPWTITNGFFSRMPSASYSHLRETGRG